jgi:hypothetical protein
MYENANLQYIETGNGFVVMVGRTLLGPAAVLPNAAINAIWSTMDAYERAGSNTFQAGFGEYTVAVDAQVLEATSRIITAMTIAGLAIGAPISIPLALGLAGAAAIAGNLDTLTDPNFWRKIGDSLSTWLEIDGLTSQIEIEFGIDPNTAGMNRGQTPINMDT